MQQGQQITTREAAAILRCHVSTVGRMVKRGDLPIVGKLPGLRGHYLLDARDVELVKLKRQQEREKARAS